MILSSRWFDIPEKAINHPVQSAWIQDLLAGNADVYTTVAGRRSYKTERAKRFMVNRLFAGKDEVFYCGAPTRIQAKDIFWKDLKGLTNSPLFKIQIKNISESELSIETKDGSILKVIGLKEFKRVQGQRCHGVLITEFQDCEPEVYTESFEPMLNDTGGFAILEGRPLGKNHLYDFYMRGVNGETGFKSYHWSAEDILSAEQITRAKNNLALSDYNREYRASFDTATGNPYYPYQPENNKKYEYNKELPLIITCDFNATVKPMSWVIGQRQNVRGIDYTYWFKVFSHQYTNTQTMCGIVDDYLKEIGYPKLIKFYGDYAGKQQRSNSSYSDWELIEKYFTNFAKFEKCTKPCRSIRDSIAATNGQLCNSLDIRKQFIDYDNCKPLALDWEKCEWKDNSRELDDSVDERGHCCRAVDYYNDYEYPIRGINSAEWGNL